MRFWMKVAKSLSLSSNYLSNWPLNSGHLSTILTESASVLSSNGLNETTAVSPRVWKTKHPTTFHTRSVIHEENAWHVGRTWRRIAGPINPDHRGCFGTLLKPAGVWNHSFLGTFDRTPLDVDGLNPRPNYHQSVLFPIKPHLIPALRLRRCLWRCNMSALERVLPVHVLLSIPIENSHMVKAAPLGFAGLPQAHSVNWKVGGFLLIL